MGEWREGVLADIVTLQRGHDLPASRRNPGPVPVIGSFGVTGFHDQARYTGPGVAIGRSGASIGVATYCPDDFWPLNTCLFVRDFKGNDPRWVYYVLDSIDFSGHNSGSAQPSLNRNYLVNIPVKVPPLEEQRRVAATLGALDDKIDRNRHVVRIASELMRALWQAWTPRFKIMAGEALTPVLGGTPRRDEPNFWRGGIAWASAKDVAGSNSGFLLSTAETISNEGVANSAAKVLPAGSIIMTARGTVGAMTRLAEPMAFNQSCYGLVPKERIHPAILYLALSEAIQRIKDAGHGTVFNTVNMATFEQIEIDLPSDEQGELAADLDALSGRVLNAERESRLLSDLRNVLLPELLSGRVRAPKVAESVGEAV